MKRVHFSLQMPRWHEWLVYGGAALLAVTGVAWLVLDRFGKIDGDFGPEQNPLLPLLLLAHGVMAYAFLIVAAMLIPVHMRLGWNAQRNRGSGLALVASTSALTITGLMLYYSSGESLRGLSSIAHWVVGLALPAMLIVHVVRGKGSRAASRRS